MLLLVAGTSATAYRLGQKSGTTLVLKSGAVPPMDYVAEPESFSKVQNTKATLAALCVRWRLDAENQLIAAEVPANASLQAPQARIDNAIRSLQQGMREFEGTEQEFEMAQDLLVGFKKTGRLEEWTQLYLKVLYENPLHPLVLRLADEAMVIGQRIGREPEILAGLKHLGGIPLEFEGKRRLATIIASAESRHLASGSESTEAPQKGS